MAVTIQNIADALGVSRNTVSKAINNTGVLADSTREKILKKAVEMGYKQLSYFTPEELLNRTGQIPEGNVFLPAGKKGGNVALLTRMALGASHFASTMLDKIQRELSRVNYSLTIHIVSAENIAQNTLPASFVSQAVDGIICVELFDSAYSRMICDLSIPTLFVDAPADLFSPRLKADVLLMDSRTNIRRIVSALAKQGIKNFGFIGDYTHCISFFERYSALMQACWFLKLGSEERFMVTGDEDTFANYDRYREYMREAIRGMKAYPDVFFCANDFIAADSITIFRELGVRVPEDIRIVGFDDSPESGMFTPPLTTIHIHSQIMGVAAVQLLLSRIREPEMHYRTVHTETSVIWRESAGPCPDESFRA